MKKCEPPNLAEAVKAVDMNQMEQARYVESVGAVAIATDIRKAISLIDASKTIRTIGNIDDANEMLYQARSLLLRLIGIE